MIISCGIKRSEDPPVGLYFQERFFVVRPQCLLCPGRFTNCWETSQEVENCGSILIRLEERLWKDREGGGDG